jgi:hypothetical protein
MGCSSTKASSQLIVKDHEEDPTIDDSDTTKQSDTQKVEVEINVLPIYTSKEILIDDTKVENVSMGSQRDITIDLQPITCPCCFEIFETDQCLKLAQCGHTVCRHCASRWIEAEYLSSSTGLVRCILTHCCSAFFTPAELKSVLPASEYNKLERRSLEHAVALDPSLRLCTTPDCPYIYSWSSTCEAPALSKQKTHQFSFRDSAVAPIDETSLMEGMITGVVSSDECCSRNMEYMMEFPYSCPPPRSRTLPAHLLSQFFPIGTAVTSSGSSGIITGIINGDYEVQLLDGNLKLGSIVTVKRVQLSPGAAGISTFVCPLCRRGECLLCNGPLHPKMTCEQYKADIDSRRIALLESGALSSISKDEELTRAYLESSEMRICRRCNNGVWKSSGCHKMQCRCGYRFCYHCGIENARCDCTPRSHGYIDNMTGRGTGYGE